MLRDKPSRLVATIRDENHKINQSKITEAFDTTVDYFQQIFNIELYIVALDEMFHLNNQLRLKAEPTDVISLPDSKYHGSIFICPEYIFTHGYDEQRIVHLFVHSLLHIAEFTHDTDEAFNIMSKHETIILQKLNIEDPYA